MAAIKVTDIAFGRLRAPDLDLMEEFLIDFGMIRAARTADALYMRGTDPVHHIHVTEKGDPAFLGLAYYARNEEDLARLAAATGAAVENIDEPGGGRRVLLTEPNGYRIEVVHGIATLPALPVERQRMNIAAEPLNRAGELMRLRPGPPQVKRIGHAVLSSPKVGATVRWFRDMLGFIGSDDLYAGAENNVIGSFNRCDRGEEYVDHHVFFCVQNERAGLNHLAFEVQDVDDVFQGHHHLNRQGKYEHMWGTGRHLLGSQIYDYWADPWGRVHEHWTDTDRLNAASGSNLLPAEQGLVSQWGEPPPDKLLRRVCP
jgi:hypothetical protein